MSRKLNPIGLTDSGLGGLSVLVQALDYLPQERFVYLADQVLMPYGDKPVHEIEARLQTVSSWLIARPCKALVMACNTATAAAAPAVRHRHPNRPIVGIEPAVKPAAMLTQTGKVGILATVNTLASERFQALVARFDSVAEVHAQPCPGLVELIEAPPIDRPAVQRLLKPRVAALLAAQVDVIVLGCTHYPFVREVVQALAGPGVQVIDTGLPVAKQLQSRLWQADLLAPSNAMAAQADALSWAKRVQFFTTGDPQVFHDGLVALLGAQFASVEVYAAPTMRLAT